MTQQRYELQRALGTAFGVAVGVGTMIGVGILRRPGEIAKLLGEPWAIYAIWLAGALYSFLGALCVAELATMIPRAGAFTVYARQALGPTAGFAVGWTDWLLNSASLAYGTIAVAELIPRFWPRTGGWTVPAALLLVASLAFVQYKGIGANSLAQQSLSLLVFLVFAGLIAACFLHAPASASSGGGAAGAGLWLLAFRSILVSYDGWYQPAYFTEENRDPGRGLPRALFGGLATVTAVYLLINAALLHIFPVATLAASAMPVSDAARLVAGQSGDAVIALLSSCALLSMANASLAGGARILLGATRALPGWDGITEVRNTGTPWAATMATALTAAAMIVSGAFDTLLNLAGVLLVVLYSSAYISLVVLRRREPAAPRPFRTPAYSVVTGVLLVSGAAFLCGIAMEDGRTFLAAIACIGVSFLLLVARRYTRQ